MAEIVPHEFRLTLLSELICHPNNARKHDDSAIDESIAENGFFKPIVASSTTSHILAGHGTFQRAMAAGMKTAPVYWLHGLTPQAELKIMLSDNRTADLSPGYDEPALAEMLKSIQAEAGSMEGTGFDAAAYDELLASITPPSDTTSSKSPNEDQPAPPIQVTRWKCPNCGHEFSPEVGLIPVTRAPDDPLPTADSTSNQPEPPQLETPAKAVVLPKKKSRKKSKPLKKKRK